MSLLKYWSEYLAAFIARFMPVFCWECIHLMSAGFYAAISPTKRNLCGGMFEMQNQTMSWKFCWMNRHQWFYTWQQCMKIILVFLWLILIVQAQSFIWFSKLGKNSKRWWHSFILLLPQCWLHWLGAFIWFCQDLMFFFNLMQQVWSCLVKQHRFFLAFLCASSLAQACLLPLWGQIGSQALLISKKWWQNASLSSKFGDHLQEYFLSLCQWDVTFPFQHAWWLHIFLIHTFFVIQGLTYIVFWWHHS